MSTDQWQQMCVVARIHSSQWLALLLPEAVSPGFIKLKTPTRMAPHAKTKKRKKKSKIQKRVGKGL